MTNENTPPPEQPEQSTPPEQPEQSTPPEQPEQSTPPERPTTGAGQPEQPTQTTPPLPPGGTFPPPPPGAGYPPPGGYPPPPPGGTFPPPPPGAGYPPPGAGYPPPGAGYPPPGGYPPPPPGGTFPPPPPGAGYAPPGGGFGIGPAGSQVGFDAGTAISYGWNGFKNNIGSIAVLALIVVALNIVTNWMAWVWQDSGLMSFVVSLLSAFVSMVISLGLIRAALIIIDGRRPEVGDLLSTNGLLQYIVAALLTGLVVFVGLLLCIIPGLIAGFLLQFFGYAIVDRRSDIDQGAPSSDPIGAMRTSYEIVSKNVGNLIVLALLCLVLNLVGALLCGIGLIVSLPVTAIAIAYAWRYFTRGVIAPQP